MGDGGFWHNGLTSGIGNAVFNEHDGVTIIVDNGYAAATGGQWIPSSEADAPRRTARLSIVDAVRGVGVRWVRSLNTYDMKGTLKILREAMSTTDKGPKVIVAQGECQLNRQRRIRPLLNRLRKAGNRVARRHYGVDAETCTGDHSCIRLSGCPSLTVKPNPDPLRRAPVAAGGLRLRGLRSVWRSRARGHSLPVVLPRRTGGQSRRGRAVHARAAARFDRLSAKTHPAQAGPGVVEGEPAPRVFKLAIAALGGQGGAAY